MNQGRIIVITGSPGTGKTTTASIVAKESNMDKSVHMHTDDFFHYLSKGAIPPHLPESNEQKGKTPSRTFLLIFLSQYHNKLRLLLL